MIPKPIYEVLPVLYVATGIATFTAAESPLVFALGALLGVTGIVLLNRRRNYRVLRERRSH